MANDPRPRGWSEVTDEEKQQICDAYATQTNPELCANFNVNRQALEAAARMFPEDKRFKTGATRRRAYLNRTKRSMSNALDEEAETGDDPADALAKHRVQEELSALRKVRKEKLDADVWTETVVRALKAQLPRLAPTSLAPPPPSLPPTSEHVLLLSDLQLGSHVDPDEMGGLSEYGWDIFLRRLARLESEIVAINRSAQTPVRRLNILALGDMADGMSIFRGQPYELDADISRQVTEGPWEISQMIVRLLETCYDRCAIYCVYGNHGRVTERKEATPVLASWDYIFMRFLEQFTANQLDKDDRRRVSFTFAKSWWLLVERLGTRFLMLHGDDVKSWLGTPFYGLEKSRQRYVNLIQQHLPPSSGPVTFDILCVGHHHTPAYIETSSGPILLNGCWPGGSKFSAKVLQAASPPAQWFAEIRDHGGLSALWNIALADPDETREVEIVTD
jgi:predicted phosphodiesterase